TQSQFPFLNYAINGVLYHAEEAERNKVSQHEYITTFTTSRLHTWVFLHNWTSRYPKHRHSQEVPLLYILAANGLPGLTRIERSRIGQINVYGGRYGLPLNAALQKASNAKGLSKSTRSAYELTVQALLLSRDEDSNASELKKSIIK